MTLESQVLFDIARSHARLACERLDETNVPFALSHLKEAQRALELIPAAKSKPQPQITIEAELIKP